MSGRPGHKTGPFKQTNKTHKNGRHKTKGELNADQKGRVSLKASRGKNSKEMRKVDRKNKQNQLRAAKRTEVLQRKRQLNGSGPPQLVVVLPLSPRVDQVAVWNVLCQACGHDCHAHPDDGVVTTLVDPTHKGRFSVVFPPIGDFYRMLDLAKVADSLLFVHTVGEDLDHFYGGLLDCCLAQGLPTTCHLLQGVSSYSAKARSSAKKNVQKMIESRFPSCGKLLPIDTEEHAKAVLWALQTGKHSAVLSRDRHPHLLVEKVSFLESNAHTDEGGQLTEAAADREDCGEDIGTLMVTGYVRSRPLSVNSLLHFTGLGTFQMRQIDSCSEQCAVRRSGDMDVSDPQVLEVADVNKQEALLCEVVPDPMDGEQTWPSEQELAEADQIARQQKAVKRVPKGTSDYQAAWIMAEEEDEEEEEDDDDEGSVAMEDVLSTKSGESSASEEEEEEEEEEEIASDGMADKAAAAAAASAETYDAEMNADEEMKQVERMRSEREHKMYPDEVDTPLDTHAHLRFQKYRGLKSFRTSPWDPKENLPPDYARIFQFANFKLTKKRVLQRSEEECDGVMPGWYVTVHVADFPRSALKNLSVPFVAYSLLPHENKMSVLHFLVRRTAGYTLPVKSKDTLVFHTGVRRFTAGPIFSQHSAGDKHKFERYLPSGLSTVASVYAPVSFPPQPLLVFHHQPLQGGGVRTVLVATGSLLSVAPRRVVCKRIVLSGHPYKINRKSAVIRYMFFNREDISWFKPVELRTKHGRRGHIKEPLGTHGHMKCVFDGQLKAQDTILLILYKRVFPKWTFMEMTENATFRTTGVENVQEDASMEDEVCRTNGNHCATAVEDVGMEH